MAVSFTGKWHNQHKSEMDITVDSTGDLSGYYRTGVGSPAPSERFDLTGFVAGDIIVFCVNFGKYESLTSWAGQATVDDAGREVIHTLWHLTKNIPDADEPAQMWGTVRNGADFFWRGPAPTVTNSSSSPSAPMPAPSHPLTPPNEP